MKTLSLILSFLFINVVNAQGNAPSVYLIHAGSEEDPETGNNRFSSDLTIRYTAEYLWGMLEATEGYENVTVENHSEAFAHSLADVYYDPRHSALVDKVGSGFSHVILMDSHQGLAYPEIFYEGAKRLSETALKAGSTPYMMLHASDYADAATLEKYAYRAANGIGIELIPGTFAMEAAGLREEGTGISRARQAWISASMIYRKITGLDPAATGYTPVYEHFTFSETLQFSVNDFTASNLTALTRFANEAMADEATREKYTTSYELDGSVIYRQLDVEQEPYNGDLRYLFKGTSTHLFTRDRINTYVGDTITSSFVQYGRIVHDTRFWSNADTLQRAASLQDSSNLNRAAFLYASESENDAFASDLTDLNGEQLIPMVFDWIKDFGGVSGTTATTNALNNENAANLWDDYFFRGWKTIPLTVGMGRLNEELPNFSASDDGGGHISDPLIYMNASMMVASSLGREFSIPETLPTRRGNWTHEQLSTSIRLGHDVLKELAYLSETLDFVPDSDLVITTKALPNMPQSGAYSFQLEAAGGTPVYMWELVMGTELPEGLSLTANGLIHGDVSAAEEARFSVKVTDSSGAFRKVGFVLSKGEFVATEITIILTSEEATVIQLPGDGSDTLSYSHTAVSNGTLTGTGANLRYTPNEGTTHDQFTYTVVSGGVVSEPKTVTILVILPDGVSSQAPATSSLRLNTGVNVSVAATLTGTSPAGTPVFARIVSQPEHGSVSSVSHNIVRYTPDVDFSGVDRFSFVMNDGELDSSEAIVEINVIGGAYLEWLEGHGLVVDGVVPVEDRQDGDGIPHLLEFVLNGDPTLSDRSVLPVVVKGEDEFIFSFHRRADSVEDIDQIFQYGTDLESWAEIDLSDAASSEFTLEAGLDGMEEVEVKIPSDSALEDTGKMFGRIKATLK